MSDPLDQLPRRIATAFRNADLKPYRVNIAMGIRAFFRKLEDAERAAEILTQMGYRAKVLRDPKRKGGWQAHVRDQ